MTSVDGYQVQNQKTVGNELVTKLAGLRTFATFAEVMIWIVLTLSIIGWLIIGFSSVDCSSEEFSFMGDTCGSSYGTVRPYLPFAIGSMLATAAFMIPIAVVCRFVSVWALNRESDFPSSRGISPTSYRMDAGQPPTQKSTVVPVGEDEIGRLQRLRDAGTISESQFDAAIAKLRGNGS